MNTLSLDTLNIILEYQGYHVFRNGRFMRRIMKTDERYAVLKTRPLIQCKNEVADNELEVADNELEVADAVKYNVNFQKTIENKYYDIDISILIENENIHWFMYVKQKNAEIGMFGDQWTICKEKCMSYYLSA